MAKKQRNRQVSPESENGVATYIREEYEETDAAPSEQPIPLEEAIDSLMNQLKKADEPKVHFDGWYALRSSVIPAVHKKEILKADFKGRKLPMEATMAEFDEALKKYGVKLV